jgi:hypothetical protein
LDTHSTYSEEATQNQKGVYIKLKELIVADENQNLSWQNNVNDTPYANENCSEGRNENWSEGRNENWSEGRNENWSDERKENWFEGRLSEERRRRIPILQNRRT